MDGWLAQNLKLKSNGLSTIFLVIIKDFFCFAKSMTNKLYYKIFAEIKL